MNLKAALVDAVDDALDRQGIYQRELAYRLGITEKHMSQIMNGHNDGSLALWSRILTELDIDLALDGLRARVEAVVAPWPPGVRKGDVLRALGQGS